MEEGVGVRSNLAKHMKQVSRQEGSEKKTIFCCGVIAH